ncbi:MAG: c-type cytochrome [Betaproteobacteria bacterium]|nr:c-type cytochrome [Betaproteobacteria bacterium]MDH3437559.1 c-type cytochrome [Betaproteobacteria bacterium]
MSEIHVEEHFSPIKTTRQLIVVMALAFAIPVGLIAILVSLVTGGDYSKNNPGMSEEAIAKRLQPVGAVVVSESGASGAEKSGKEVYEAVCAACHSSGVLNAPKFGDRAAWAKLIAKSQERLTADAMKGVRQMPPRGGNPNLTDTEFARAVVYMANAAGADWKAPASKAALASPTAAAPAPAPAAAPAPAPTAQADPAKGQAVYEKACMTCHAAGIAGAPKAGDKSAWASRLKMGQDHLYTSALKGKGAMPAKGGNVTLPDADVKAAVDYMLSLGK